MKLVLFDLDGTLLDTGALYAESYRRGFAEVLEAPPTWEEMLRRKPASERSFLVDWHGERQGALIHDAVVAAYDALAEELLGGFFDGVPEMLDALRGEGVRMGIVTGKSRRAYASTVRHARLEGFEVIVLEEDVPQPKPDPGGIRKALREMGADGEPGVYVGDTPMDVEAAHAAGLVAGAALWARAEADRAQIAARLGAAERGAEVWVLEHPADLLRRLGSR